MPPANVSRLLVTGAVAFLAACAQPAGSGTDSAALPRSEISSDSAWEQVVEAAKKEGTVAVLAPIGSDIRDVLTEGFERKYGITVEYQALRGAELTVRIGTEREAGKFLWDVYVSGTTTAIADLRPIGALDPLEPALVLSEVTDPKN